MINFNFETEYNQLVLKLSNMEDILAEYDLLEKYYTFTLPEAISFTGLISDEMYSYYYPPSYKHQTQKHSGKWAFILPPNDNLLQYLQNNIMDLEIDQIIKWRQVEWFELLIYVSDIFDRASTKDSWRIVTRMYDIIKSYYHESELTFFRLKFKAEFITSLQNPEVLTEFVNSKPRTDEFTEQFKTSINQFVNKIQLLFVDQFGNFIDFDLST